MDIAREPGVRLSGIVVDRIRFDDLDVGSTPSKNLRFEVSLSRKIWKSPSPALDVSIGMRVATGDPTAKFSLELTMTGRFEPIEEAPNFPLPEFAKVNAPAIVMPFVRELVANITARSRQGIVLVPPMNVATLAQRQPEVIVAED